MIVPPLLDPATVADSHLPPELVVALKRHGSLQDARRATCFEAYPVTPEVRVKLRLLGDVVIAQLDFTIRLTEIVRGLPTTWMPAASVPVIVIVPL